MSWIADAHREWHTVNGWDQVCPLDCGVMEGVYAEAEAAEEAAAEEAAHAAFRAKVEAARTEAIATGRTVKVEIGP